VDSPVQDTQLMQIDTEDTNTAYTNKRQKVCNPSDDTSTPTSNDNMEISNEKPTKSGDCPLTLKNSRMTSDSQTNKTTDQNLPRPALPPDMVFSPSNPYIENSHGSDSHADHHIPTEQQSIHT